MRILSTAVIFMSIAVPTALGFVVGQKTVKIPHAQVYDIATQQFAPLNIPDGAQIIVVSPKGFEAGVKVAQSKNGKFVLIMPLSLAPGGADQDNPVVEPPKEPAKEPDKKPEPPAKPPVKKDYQPGTVRLWKTRV
jgi:hypothetical protein